MVLEREVQESKTIEDGLHTGVLKGVKARNSGGFDYVDILIGDIDGDKDSLIITCSAPDKLSPKTKLGLIVAEFGATVEVGKKIDLEGIFIDGTPVSFQTVRQRSKKDPTKQFVRVVEGSLKPKKEAAKAASTIPELKCKKCKVLTNILDEHGVCDFCKNADIKVERKSGPSSLHSNTDKEKLVEDAQAFLS